MFRMSNFSAFSVLPIVVALFSCGEQKPVNNREFIGVPVEPFSEDWAPREHFLTDTECQALADEVLLTETSITSPLSLTDEMVRLNRTVTRASLQNQVVSVVDRGGHYTRGCNRKSSNVPVSCVSEGGSVVRYKVKEAAAGLRVCNDRYNYPRDSFERAALETTYHLQSAYIQHLNYTAEELSPVSLEVFPTFESTYFGFKDRKGDLIHKSFVETHNMIYQPRQQKLIVYPAPKFVNPLYTANLWEVDFAVIHELGHHIQTHYLHDAFSQIGFAWRSTGDEFESRLQAGANRNLFIAFAEGTADMMSFYLKGQSMETLRDISCIYKNRNILSGQFGDVREKILDREILEMFDSQKSTPTECPHPSYTSPHTIGAIMGYQANQLFDALMVGVGQETAGEAAARMKYNLTLDWLKRVGVILKSVKMSEQTSGAFLKKIVSSLMKVVEGSELLQKTAIDSSEREKLLIRMYTTVKTGFPDVHL